MSGMAVLKRGRDEGAGGDWSGMAFGGHHNGGSPSKWSKRVRPASEEAQLMGRHIAASACSSACRAETRSVIPRDIAHVGAADDPWNAARSQLLHELGVGPLQLQAVLREEDGSLGPLWHCFTDLNLLCRQHAPDFRAGPLKSYHSMRPAAKDAIFQQFLQTYGAMLAESTETSALFDFVHQVALRDTTRVSLATFCLPAPPFLHIWCGKYGIDPDRVCLYQVQGYDDDRVEPARVIYIPHLSRI